METTLEIISDYELERGKPMPSKLHSRIQTKLIAFLENNYESRYNFFSELSLDLNDWSSVPDISIFPKTDIDYLHDEVQVTQAPLCTVEILSPSQSLTELVNKAENYFNYGVKTCWLVIPTLKNIYVFTDRTTYEIFKNDDLLTDTNLGITVPLGKIFV